MEWFLTASLVLLSLILLIKQGLCDSPASAETGIMCYSCNSHDDPNCGNPFRAHHYSLVNCSDLNYLDAFAKEMLKVENKTQPNFCRKNYQTVTLGNRTDTRIVRGCGYMSKQKTKYGEEEEEETNEERCFRKAGTFEVMIYYCTCTTDKCNGAGSLGSDFLQYRILVLPLILLGIASAQLNLPISSN